MKRYEISQNTGNGWTAVERVDAWWEVKAIVAKLAGEVRVTDSEEQEALCTHEDERTERRREYHDDIRADFRQLGLVGR